VFAGVGSASGVLSGALDVSIVVMVIATTFVAPLWLRGVLGSGEATAATTAAPEAPSSLLELQAEVTEQDRKGAEGTLEPVPPASERLGIPES
jgi:hypothetical protein